MMVKIKLAPYLF